MFDKQCVQISAHPISKLPLASFLFSNAYNKLIISNLPYQLKIQTGPF